MKRLKKLWCGAELFLELFSFLLCRVGSVLIFPSLLLEAPTLLGREHNVLWVTGCAHGTLGLCASFHWFLSICSVACSPSVQEEKPPPTCKQTRRWVRTPTLPSASGFPASQMQPHRPCLVVKHSRTWFSAFLSPSNFPNPIIFKYAS